MRGNDKSTSDTWALSLLIGVALGLVFGMALDDISIGIALGFAAGVFYELFWKSTPKRGAGGVDRGPTSTDLR